jgi:hypothetical protein
MLIFRFSAQRTPHTSATYIEITVGFFVKITRRIKSVESLVAKPELKLLLLSHWLVAGEERSVAIVMLTGV